MSDAAIIGQCHWSPTGFARQLPSGRCTCEPRLEDGSKPHPKIVYDWERRIQRILAKQGVEYSMPE